MPEIGDVLNDIPDGTLFFDCKICRLKIGYEDFISDSEWCCGRCSMDDWDLKKVRYVKVKSVTDKGEI